MLNGTPTFNNAAGEQCTFKKKAKVPYCKFDYSVERKINTNNPEPFNEPFRKINICGVDWIFFIHTVLNNI